MNKKKDWQTIVPVLAVVIAACALLLAGIIGFDAAALRAKDARIANLELDAARLEKTVDDNINKLSEQQQEIDRLRTHIDTLPAKPIPPPKTEPIVLRGTTSQRDETQLEAVPFAGKGSLIMKASATQWATDTSIGLQIWHPREDGIVFRGGCYRVVKNGNAVVNEPIPGWDQLKRGEHTYEITWNPKSLTLKIDDKRIATIPARDLPSRSTEFLIRYNADYDDVLTIHSYHARYTDASGRMVTVP